MTTIYTPGKEDDKRKCNEGENTASIEEIAEMFQQLNDHGIRYIGPKQCSLNIIGQRYRMVEQDIPVINATIPDLLVIQ